MTVASSGPIAACVVAVAIWAVPATGQTVAVETAQFAGASSESLASAAVQVRALAEPRTGLRLLVEGAWGDRTRQESDAFGTAYPYGGRLDVIEAFAEWERPLRGVLAVKGGRYRTPFGLSGASDHAYIGFLRPPLIRYNRYYALSSGYLEHGADALLGVPGLSAEVSVGRPGDVGTAIRRPGVSTSARVQASLGPVIAGASVLDTPPYLPARFALGRARFAGVDARWMQRGLLVRGEWLDGQPFDGATTAGGHVDAVLHTRAMGPLTVLARAERLAYDASASRRLFTHRYSTAFRVRSWQRLWLSVGVAHQRGQLTQRRRTALDVGVGWATRHEIGAAR